MTDKRVESMQLDVNEVLELKRQLAEVEERVEASYQVELDLLREIGEILEPVEYSGSYAVGIKAAIKQAKLEGGREALMDASNEINEQDDMPGYLQLRCIADNL